ncbi:hypothetical protein AB6A40_001595 [Gnathostoma spinigerum]|uniref:Mannosyl-oligosaccharide glucosidase n=1 Tax=Gnathostoma spinigerum TaxID=75299 RepID=A0ABD6E5T2_9BILA
MTEKNDRHTIEGKKQTVSKFKNAKTTEMSRNTRLLIVAVLIVLLSIVIQRLYMLYIYLPGIISTKSDLPLVSDAYSTEIWGTYRSHMYFGLRTQHPESPLFGLMWYEQPPVENLGSVRIRHWCQLDDGVLSYGWTEADGRTFGRQTIQERSYILTTDWLNQGKSWTSRIQISSQYPSSYALIFYFILQDSKSVLTPRYVNGELNSISGSSAIFGNFRLMFGTPAGNADLSFFVLDSPKSVDLKNLKEIVLSSTVIAVTKNGDQRLRLNSGYYGEASRKNARAIFLQMNINANSSVEISFFNENDTAVTGDAFDEIMSNRVRSFNEKFESVFGLADKGYGPFYQHMGRAALSNMLGSIGFFFGSNKVQSTYSTFPSSYGPHSLLTSVPSRSSFPRGFIWDEGFHHLLLGEFDPELSLKILASWLDTMNTEGWIPREMILGEEAEERVPAEFIVQSDKIANPPMILYLINRMLLDSAFMAKYSSKLTAFYPRLRAWYKWLRTTQTGPLPGTFTWQGRNATTDLELNPKTLPSGLDDYPRASHPSTNEYHVDLLSWMAISARSLTKLAELVGDTESREEFLKDSALFANIDHIDKLHWSDVVKRYCDYGLHSSSVVLKRPKIDPKKLKHGDNILPMRRFTLKEPTERLVDDAFGYISLFPVMLCLVPPDSDKLGHILSQLRDDQNLWSEFGLRSLSKSSPYYNKYNTEHDPPYWRGSVWLNMNYLMLAALKHYSTESGPYQELAFTIYSQLRNAVVSNVAREFKRTGYLWESYEDDTGKGHGAHPFTGWSSLVLNIMAEKYI